MAANLIKFDKTKDITRHFVRAITMIREGLLILEQQAGPSGIIIQARDGDGSQAVHYDQFASEGGYSPGDYADNNAAAKASADELFSLYGKIGTDAATSNVRTAIMQACAKHGV